MLSQMRAQSGCHLRELVPEVVSVAICWAVHKGVVVRTCSLGWYMLVWCDFFV